MKRRAASGKNKDFMVITMFDHGQDFLEDKVRWPN